MSPTTPDIGKLLASHLAAVPDGALPGFLAMLERKTFHRFAYYCWTVGVTYLVAAAIWPTLR